MPTASKSRNKNTHKTKNNGTTARNRSTENVSSAGEQLADVITPLYLKGVTRVAEFQKDALSMAAEQTAELIGVWKNALSHFPMSPAGLFFDVAAQSVRTTVETQKGAIDLLVEQTEAMTEIARERAKAYAKIAENANGAFQATVMRSVEAQKRVLETASEQNKTILAETRRKVGHGAGAALVDAFERGTDTMVKAQKSILDATSQPFMASQE